MIAKAAAPVSQKELSGIERKLFEAAAVFGLVGMALAVALMSLSMNYLPGW